MPDRDKVVRGIKHCINNSPCCMDQASDCEYCREYGYNCILYLMSDAFELIENLEERIAIMTENDSDGGIESGNGGIEGRVKQCLKES